MQVSDLNMCQKVISQLMKQSKTYHRATLELTIARSRAKNGGRKCPRFKMQSMRSNLQQLGRLF